MSPKRGSKPRRTDRLVVGRNVTLTLEGFIMYTVQMGSGATIYIPSLIKIGSGIQKLLGDAQNSMVIA
jgi:hypothetical protein